MSDIQIWLMAMASTVFSQPWSLVIASATLVGCAALFLLVVRLRQQRTHSRASQTSVTLPSQGAAPSRLSDRIAVPVAPVVAPAAPTSTPLHAPLSAPLRVPHDRREEPLTTNYVAGSGASYNTTALLTPLANQALVVTRPKQRSAEQVSEALVDTALTTAVADAPTAEVLAEQEYRQGLRLIARQSMDREASLHAALACLRRAQECWTRDRAPERWATIQNDIGRIYQELPTGDRGRHAYAAIMHHESALEVFDPRAHPLHWAWTQAALGAAYLNNPRGSALANARAAVAYYQRALDVFTPETTPLAWAWTRNNLGAALETVRGAEGERVACLRDAATCYELSLRVFTSETYPVQHELVSRNLDRVRGELHALE